MFGEGGFGLDDLAESEMAQPPSPPHSYPPQFHSSRPLSQAEIAAGPVSVGHSGGQWKNILIGAAVASALIYFFVLCKRRS